MCSLYFQIILGQVSELHDALQGLVSSRDGRVGERLGTGVGIPPLWHCLRMVPATCICLIQTADLAFACTGSGFMRHLLCQVSQGADVAAGLQPGVLQLVAAASSRLCGRGINVSVNFVTDTAEFTT